MPRFPGIKVLQLKNVQMNIAGVEEAVGGSGLVGVDDYSEETGEGVGAAIMKIAVRIPASQITGPTPEVYARSSDDNTGVWEKVSGDITTKNGVVLEFENTGTRLDLRIIGSGTVLSGLDSLGRIVPAIYCRVVEAT